jgi:hypothetical protein
MNACIEKCCKKPPDKFCRYSEADLQSGVSIMLVESHKIEQCDVVVAGISF